MRLESQPVNMLQVAGHKKERSKKIYNFSFNYLEQ